MGSSPNHIVEFEEALEIVRGQMRSGAGTGRVTLLEAAGRVLAEAVVADRDQPPFDRSTRDGFAVRVADLATGQPLEVVGQVRAGQVWDGPSLAPGTTIEIMTGAPVPPGADMVLMVESTLAASTGIQPLNVDFVEPGTNVVVRGSEARVGQQVVAPGTRIGAAEIAMAATCGCSELTVYTRPTVAILATGDELVEVAEMPNGRQIRNSNSYAIAAMVAAAGGKPVRLPIAPDTREAIRERLEEARKCDLIILSGGVSMGEYDLVEEVLAEFGAEFLFTGVKMQPGKPLVFGKLGAIHFFGLPGNPISTQVTFHCFVEIFLRALSGETTPEPRWAQATLAEDVVGKRGLTRLLPARMDGISARLVGWQGSGDLAANARANCYAELMPGKDYASGEVIRVLLR